MRFQKSWTAGWRHSPYFGLLAPSKMGDEQMQGHSRERAQRAGCNSKWLIVLILTILVVVSLVIGFTVYAVTRSGQTYPPFNQQFNTAILSLDSVFYRPISVHSIC